MCELLGMSANVPTDINFSLSGLISRGGKLAHIKMVGGSRFMKGWGVALLKILNLAFYPQWHALCRSIQSNRKR